MALTLLSDALAQVLAEVPKPPKTETLAVTECLGRVLAEPVIARVNVPPFDNSAMDGFAVRSGDLPGEVLVSQRIPAGAVAEPLAPNSAARIFTGAMIPLGADTVVMQEDAVVQNERVAILGCLTPGQHIRRAGDDIGADTEVLAQGCLLTPQDLGLAASVGCATLTVYRPLTVAVLTTGDELVEPGNELAPGQIYNSNRVQVEGLLRGLGCQVQSHVALADDPEKIGSALEAAAESADCIITCGGVSVGEEDHVRDQIEARGKLGLWRLAIKPGKPLAFGNVAGCPIFGLPGNPVSAWVTFIMVVKPWLLRAQGGSPQPYQKIAAIAGFNHDRPGTREEYLRVRLLAGSRPEAQLAGNQSSGALSSVSRSDGLAIIPIGTTVTVGDAIEVITMSDLLSPISC